MRLKPQHLVTGLLALMLISSAALLGRKIMRPVDVPVPKQSPAPGKKTITDKQLPLKAYGLISKSSLLGAPAPARRDPKKLPQAKINARLMGTIHADDPELARAIVQIRKSQDLMRVGDSIGKASIVEINRRSIVLSTNGREEVLNMPE